MFKSFRKSKKMRDATIWLVVILLASYVLLSFGEAPPTAQGDTITALGSSKIKVADAWIRQSELRGRFGRTDQSVIDNFTVSQLMNSAIMLDGADELDIRVSDDELRDYVIQYRTDPEGNFTNSEDWAYFIKNRYQVQVGSFEEYLRQNHLRTNKFTRVFFDTAFVSEEDIEERFLENNRKVKLEMLILNTTDIKSEVKVDTDEQLKAIVDANQDQFRTGPQRKIQFVRIPFDDFKDSVEVSDAEAEDYYTQNANRYQLPERVKASRILLNSGDRTPEQTAKLADDIKTEIDGGLDFAAAVTKYSEALDNEKTRGGNLGLLQRNNPHGPQFTAAAFAMEAGTVSNPVITDKGTVLIKVEEHLQQSMRPLDEVRAAIKNTLERNKTKDAALGKASAFHALVKDSGKDFAEAAAEVKYEVQTSDFFDQENGSNLGEVLKNNFSARRAAFALENLNDISEPVSLIRAAIVMQWVEEGEPRDLTVENDRTRVRNKAQDVGSEIFIKNLMAEIRTAATAAPDSTFKELKGKRDYLKENHFRVTDWVDSNTVPFEIRQEVDFAELFATENGTILEKIQWGQENRFVMVRLLEKQEADMEKLAEERFELINNMRSEKGGDLLYNYTWVKQKEFDPDGEKRARLADVLSKR